jgi:hypothetical protein
MVPVQNDRRHNSYLTPLQPLLSLAAEPPRSIDVSCFGYKTTTTTQTRSLISSCASFPSPCFTCPSQPLILARPTSVMPNPQRYHPPESQDVDLISTQMQYVPPSRDDRSADSDGLMKGRSRRRITAIEPSHGSSKADHQSSSKSSSKGSEW